VKQSWTTYSLNKKYNRDICFRKEIVKHYKFEDFLIGLLHGFTNLAVIKRQSELNLCQSYLLIWKYI